jgi:hypothetical protein
MIFTVIIILFELNGTSYINFYQKFDSGIFINNQSLSYGPNRKGLLFYYCKMGPFLFSKAYTSFFSFAFSSVSCCSFWFMIVLLLDLRMERSFTRFLRLAICYSRSRMASCFLVISFSSY